MKKSPSCLLQAHLIPKYFLIPNKIVLPYKAANLQRKSLIRKSLIMIYSIYQCKINKQHGKWKKTCDNSRPYIVTIKLLKSK